MLSVKGDRGEIEILAINASTHGRGIGARMDRHRGVPRRAGVGARTPYFEVRNIHFVNKCGFIVEFFMSTTRPSDSGMDKTSPSDSSSMRRPE